MIELVVLTALLGGMGIFATEATQLTSLTHQQTNTAMRELAPVIAREFRKNPVAAQEHIRRLSFADKDWLRWYAGGRMQRNLFGWETKSLLELIEKISAQMRTRVRLAGGAAAALTTVIAAGMLVGFMAAKILQHTIMMAAYSIGAIVALVAAAFIVSFMIREEGFFASSFSNLKNLGMWDKAILMRSLSSKLRGYIKNTTPLFNPNGPVIATSRDMHGIVSEMGLLQRLLGRVFA